MPGTIVFKPVEANLTRDTDLIGKMNPYCCISVGHTKFNGSICKKGGKHPQWIDTITIPVRGNEPTAVIEVMDKDKITKDDSIGGCTLNLQQLQIQGQMNGWFPLYHKNNKCGEILLQATYQDGLGQSGLNCSKQQGFFAKQREMLASKCSGNQQQLAQQQCYNQNILGELDTSSTQSGEYLLRQQEQERYSQLDHSRVYTEQHQVVQPHTFMKPIQVTEVVPVQKEIEVIEPRTVLKEVQYTELVPVTKQMEVTEPVVVTKEVEVMEPILVNKTIEVIENVPVKKMVEVIEMKNTIKDVETYEPQTFKKTVEVTEQFPVKKTIEVTEPITVTKAVEFVQPIITTQKITKEEFEPVIVNEKITKQIGPATLVGFTEELDIKRSQLTSQLERTTLTEERRWEEQRRMLDEEKKLLEQKSLSQLENQSNLLGQDQEILNRKTEVWKESRISGFGTNKVEKADEFFKVNY